MPVVSNTSPLLSLAVIGELRLLHEQFDAVLLPPAVKQELRLNTALPGTTALREAMQAGWLRVSAVQNWQLVELLRRELDRGEAEAIALAVDQNMLRVLLDEREGRLLAQRLGLNVTGTLGVLLRGKLQGRIPSLQTAIHNLRERIGFFIDANLEREVLRQAGEL